MTLLREVGFEEVYSRIMVFRLVWSLLMIQAIRWKEMVLFIFAQLTGRKCMNALALYYGAA
jgi:hypothetical protein